MMFQFPYTSKETISQTIQTEISDLNPTPKVYFSKNPLHCLSDTAQDLEYAQENTIITVCPNLISSETSLKASIAREKYWISTRSRNIVYTDDQEAIHIITACKQEMGHFKSLDPITKEQGAKLCAKIHSKLKIPNKKNRKIDAWHFYTRNLIEENWYSYNN